MKANTTAVFWRMVFVAGCAIVTLFSGQQVIYAGQAAPPPVLVSVVKVELDQTGHQVMQISVSNASGQNVKAVVLRLELLDTKGKTKFVANDSLVKASMGPMSQQVWGPGESWLLKWRTPVKGTFPNYNLSVDYVVLSNDSLETTTSWGPDRSKESEGIRGTVDGVKAERERLRQLSQLQGSDALVGDLQGGGIVPKEVPERSSVYNASVRGGRAAERGRLRQIFKEGGKEALVQDLYSDVN